MAKHSKVTGTAPASAGFVEIVHQKCDFEGTIIPATEWFGKIARNEKYAFATNRFSGTEEAAQCAADIAEMKAQVWVGGIARMKTDPSTGSGPYADTMYVDTRHISAEKRVRVLLAIAAMYPDELDAIDDDAEIFRMWWD